MLLKPAQHRWLQSDVFPGDLLSFPGFIPIGKMTLTSSFLSHPLSIFCDQTMIFYLRFITWFSLVWKEKETLSRVGAF